MDEKTRNRRLVKLYGITSVEYDAILADQGGGCAICGRPAKTIRLSVDHDHKWKRVPIQTEKDGVSGWKAKAHYRHWTILQGGDKRNELIRRIRRDLRRLSVRGILCFPCNSGLRKYSDDPARLLGAATYLHHFQTGHHIVPAND